MKYVIQINRETCIGDGMCCEEAPFTLGKDDDLKAFVVNPQGDPPQHILAAARSCRLDAITLHDSATGEKVWPLV